MKVRIVISSPEKISTYIIKDETSSFVSPAGAKKIDTNVFFEKLTTIIKGWPEELEEISVQDGTSCVIMLAKNNEEFVYMFHNKFPQNYSELLNLLRGYENGSVN